MKNTKMILFVIIEVLLSSSLFGTSINERVYSELPIKEVTIFKDGHSFVLHEGEVMSDVNGDIVLEDLPEPIMGTFWAYSAEPENSIQCVIAGQNEVEYGQPAANMSELLKVNVNKQILLKEKTLQQPYQAEVVNVLNDQLVLLRMREGTKALSVSQIQNVTFLDNPENDLMMKKSKESLVIKLKEKAKKANIGMAYVQKGLRWIPSYRVEIDGKGRAKIKLQGTIVNELADIENVKAHLVVGVPNFAFQDILDPMSLKETAAQLSRQMNRYNNNRTSMMLSNSIATQTAYFDNDYYQAEVGNQAGSGPELKGADKTEDLFIFSLDNVNLKKGQRMVIPIAAYELTYTDIYTVDMGFQPPLEMSRSFNSQQHLDLAKQFCAPKAVHKIRLKNKSSYPLTTAPATIFKDGRILSQSLMTYTPIGSDGDLVITTAVDIKVKSKNKQESVDNNAIKWNGDHYSKVSMIGEVNLANYGDKTVKVYVKRSVLGNIEQAETGEVKQLGHGYDGLLFDNGLPFWWNWCNWPWWWYHFNSVGQASWEVELEPGQDLKLEYRWHYFWR